MRRRSKRSSSASISRLGPFLRLAWSAALTAGVLASPVSASWRAEGNPLVTGRGLVETLRATGDGSGGILILTVGLDAPRLGLQRGTGDGRISEGWPSRGVDLDVGSGGWQNFNADGSGGAYVSWRRLTPGHSFVVVQHILADGIRAPGWPDSGAVAVDGRIGPAVLSLANGASGDCFVAWQDFRHGYTGHQDPYVQRLAVDGSIASGWLASGLPLCEAPGDQYDPVLLPDGEGGIFAAWWDRRDSLTTDLDIYVQRLRADGSRPAGWPADGLAVCTAPGYQALPAICSDGAGGVFVAWHDARAGSNHVAISVQRVLPDARVAPGWPEDGRLVGPGNDWMGLDLAPDGAGGVYLAWPEVVRVGDTERARWRVTRVTPDGQIADGWPSGGLLPFGDATIGGGSLLPDGDGGALVYTNLSGDEGRGVRLLRLTSAGQPHAAWVKPWVEWTWNTGWGTAAVASDGAGGAILAWIETLGDAARRDVYAQRIDANGAFGPGWDGYPGSSWLACPEPNPVRGETRIRFALPVAGPVSLEVFDARGARVARVLDGEVRHAGQHVQLWNGRDAGGRRLPSGAYFLRMQVGSMEDARAFRVNR